MAELECAEAATISCVHIVISTHFGRRQKGQHPNVHVVTITGSFWSMYCTQGREHSQFHHLRKGLRQCSTTHGMEVEGYYCSSLSFTATTPVPPHSHKCINTFGTVPRTTMCLRGHPFPVFSSSEYDVESIDARCGLLTAQAACRKEFGYFSGTPGADRRVGVYTRKRKNLKIRKPSIIGRISTPWPFCTRAPTPPAPRP